MPSKFDGLKNSNPMPIQSPKLTRQIEKGVPRQTASANAGSTVTTRVVV